MRIAVVHGLERGGAARRLAGTVEVLRQRPDVTVREFCLSGCTHVLPDAVTEIGWTPQAPSRSRFVRPWWRYRDAAGARSAWSRVWREVDGWGADAVFANPCFVPGGAPPLMAQAVAPVLYYCDEPRRVDYEKSAARASNPLTRIPYAPMRRLHRHDERASVAAAAAIATNSAFTAARIMAAYGRSAEVVTPGIADIFTADPARVLPRESRRHVLSVGTLIPSKGHDLVIEAVAAAGVGRPLVVVAPRHNPTEEGRLQARADALGVPLSIRTGITDEQLATLYGSAFATLYLAREEPLGLVSLESQACGTPVVVADDGGLVETLVDGVTGFEVARTAQGAASALRRLADPQTWQGMALEAARREVPRDRSSARAVLAMLHEITGRPAPSSDEPAVAPGAQRAASPITASDTAHREP